MRVSLIRPSELGRAEIASWHSMQLATASLANPFLSPEFAQAVGRVRPNAQIAVLTEGQSIVGFFPFERQGLGMGVPIGGRLSHYQGLIHALGIEWQPRELLKECRLSAWEFDNLIIDQQSFRPYHAAIGPSPIIDLSDGFDAYYSKVRMKAPRFCRELARKTRKLGREVGELRIVADSRDRNLLHTLVAWKSEQYRRARCADSFKQPWVVTLLEALLATCSSHASGLLSILYAGDQPVAGQFGLRTGNLLVGWYTAYDLRFAKYSPGLIHLKQMAGQLAASGIDVISMGKGAVRYTKNLKSHDMFVAEGIVTNRSVLGAAHGVQSSSTRWAVHTVRHHPRLHRVTDQMLRQTGASRWIYHRI
jgi:CelD/BcsL family acetyltransferase involved in cellulose biosynthesis